MTDPPWPAAVPAYTPAYTPACVPAAELTAAAQRGDEAAMNELLRVLMPHVSAVCAPIAGRDASDAVQEALIAIFLGLPRLRDLWALPAWARKVSMREAMRVRRKSPTFILWEHDDLTQQRGHETRYEIGDLLQRLSTEHCDVLMLRDVFGYDEKSTAGFLGISVGTVKSRLHRARRSFRAEWDRSERDRSGQEPVPRTTSAPRFSEPAAGAVQPRLHRAGRDVQDRGD
jgi:RNA polymerase sigma-70 factor (ECF subfamily)